MNNLVVIGGRASGKQFWGAIVSAFIQNRKLEECEQLIKQLTRNTKEDFVRIVKGTSYKSKDGTIKTAIKIEHYAKGNIEELYFAPRFDVSK